MLILFDILRFLLNYMIFYVYLISHRQKDKSFMIVNLIHKNDFI